MIKRVLLGLIVLLVALVVGGGLHLRSELPKYQAGFIYAFGPYEFVRTLQELSSQREAEDGMFTTEAIAAANPDWSEGAFLNRHVHNTRLADDTSRAITTPNNDTLYTSAVLELSATPVELIVPEVGERYLSIALMDVFTDQFAHIGPRETGGRGGRFWIVGPDHTGRTPVGVTAIRATSNDVWLLARIFVSGESDLAAAREAQQGISVRPIFAERSPRPFETRVTNISDSANFVAVVNEALARNPDHPQSARAAAFAELGLGVDGRAGPVSRFLWSLVTPRAEAALSEQIAEQMSARAGWSNPPPNIGYYGDDDLTRTAIALIGFGALRREDAIYYRMTKTDDGALLDGTQNYTLILPADVPAQAFWSIALYEPDETGRFFFYANATGRHSLNSGTDGLIRREDGSVVLEIGPDAPDGQTANWMPTPEGPFAAFFRVYLPEPDAVEQDWTPPSILRD